FPSYSPNICSKSRIIRCKNTPPEAFSDIRMGKMKALEIKCMEMKFAHREAKNIAFLFGYNI
ncbi:MAG: hypothetical protein IJF01_05790, partial [Tidjanibacter sp.]|nr:hypothetical protein [Tidjanibacter sp.]